MAVLIEENFLNEERFAKAFVTGKFRQNKWGKQKIKMQLKAKRVSSYCIRKGLEEIDEEDYINVLERLWNKKYLTLRDADEYVKKQKVIKFLLGKGYDYEDIKQVGKS